MARQVESGYMTSVEALEALGYSKGSYSVLIQARKAGHFKGLKEVPNPGRSGGTVMLYPESEVMAFKETSGANPGRGHRNGQTASAPSEDVSLAATFEAKLSYAIHKIFQEYEQAMRKKVAEEITGRGR